MRRERKFKEDRCGGLEGEVYMKMWGWEEFLDFPLN